MGLGAHTTNFRSSEIPLFSGRSYGEVFTIRMSTSGSWGDTIQPITRVFLHNTIPGSVGDPKYYKTFSLWEQGKSFIQPQGLHHGYHRKVKEQGDMGSAGMASKEGGRDHLQVGVGY